MLHLQVPFYIWASLVTSIWWYQSNTLPQHLEQLHLTSRFVINKRSEVSSASTALLCQVHASYETAGTLVYMHMLTSPWQCPLQSLTCVHQ